MKANRQKDQFWKDTDTWRDEPDFWRKGIMTVSYTHLRAHET